MEKMITRIMIIGCLLCLFVGCNKDTTIEKNRAEETAIEMDEAEENIQTIVDHVITWTIPDKMNPAIIERNVPRVNEKLKEEGYNFTLQIKTLKSKSYREDVLSLLETGEADIVSTGVNMADGSLGYSQDFIRKGYLMELSEYLCSEEGRFLKEWYHEDEWKRIETDGSIYVLPSQNNVYGSFFLAFNKRYVTEEMLEKFSGTPGEVKELLTSIDIPEEVYGILGTSFSMSSLYAMSGVSAEYGVFYDLATGIAENPFQNELFYKHVQDINSLYTMGSMKVFEERDALILEQQAVRDGNFVVWIGYKKDAFYEEIKDTVYVVPVQQSMVNALSSTSGISAKSDNKEEALQLLTLLYTNETYANLLLFGEKGTDYQLIDGYVCNMQGDYLNNNSRSWIFGTLDMAYPCSSDLLVIDKNVTQDKFFASEYYLDSAILGFQPDCTVFSADMKNSMMILDRYSRIWQEENLAATWEKANVEFEFSGGKELVEELNRQVAEWMSEK